MLEIMRRQDLMVNYGPPLLGDIMQFDVSNESVARDLSYSFNQDFWGTLESSIADAHSFLALDQ
jgi:hypothetical protein